MKILELENYDIYKGENDTELPFDYRLQLLTERLRIEQIQLTINKCEFARDHYQSKRDEGTEYDSEEKCPELVINEIESVIAHNKKELEIQIIRHCNGYIGMMKETRAKKRREEAKNAESPCVNPECPIHGTEGVATFLSRVFGDNK